MTIAQIQVRRGTSSQWSSDNPTLASGEWGLETDTGKVKMGNGGTAWNSLAYFPGIDVAALQAEIDVLGPRQILKITASGSFTKATYPWLKYVRARLVGAGGGGAGAASTSAGQTAIGAAGGHGGYAEAIVDAASLGASVTVTVGAGGAGGAAGANAGSNGGASSFGTFASASGGFGRASLAATSGDGAYQQVAGCGVGTVGDILLGDGSAGGFVGFYSGGIFWSGISNGSPSKLGNGGVSGNGGNGASPTLGYGGGGGGVFNLASQSAHAGAAGAGGVVYLELYG